MHVMSGTEVNDSHAFPAALQPRAGRRGVCGPSRTLGRVAPPGLDRSAVVLPPSDSGPGMASRRSPPVRHCCGSTTGCRGWDLASGTKVPPIVLALPLQKHYDEGLGVATPSTLMFLNDRLGDER